MSEPFVPYPVSQDEHNRLIEQNIILTARLAEAEAERDGLQSCVDSFKGTDVHRLRGCVNVLSSKLAEYTGKTVPCEITGAESVIEQLAECRRLLREACEMPRYCTRFEEWKERAAKAGGVE